MPYLPKIIFSAANFWAVASILVAGAISGCSSGFSSRLSGLERPSSHEWRSQRKVRAANRRRLRVGRPYVIAGRRYVPRFDPHYDRTGIGSWYGPGFHGRKTANGEIYDQHGISAAHPTLPLNSLVRVTNLQNGRSLVLRINDRGPFVNNRLIDLSKGAANRLGFTGSGLARVRVQVVRG